MIISRKKAQKAKKVSPFEGLIFLRLLRLLAAVGSVLAGQFALAAQPAAKPADAERATLIVVTGAPGEAEFGQQFRDQLAAWQKIGAQAGVKTIAIGNDDAAAPDDRTRLEQALAAEQKEGAAELWLVLLGHGTFDGKEAKFNLRGPDLAAADLAAWLKAFARPLAIVDTSSSSAPFLATLAGKGRVVITSTRSGYQQNFARFGKYFTDAIGDPKSDLDRDGQVSLLEAFLSGSHRTMEFYQTEGRLATEHALIDDNGDGLGTPADWFKGVRAVKRAKEGAPVDGARAQQYHLVRSAAEQHLAPEVRAKRDALELEVARLRDAKAKLPEDAYFRDLEKLLLQIAALYEGS
jgi:hypothetical protein